MRRSSWITSLPWLAVVLVMPGVAEEPALQPAWPPFAMPVVEPIAPPDRTFDIRDFGAVADAATLNTQAIARAMAECSAAGGGRVLVPKGVWLTGPVHLKSNVHLHLEAEAELRFSRRFEDYLPAVYMQRGGVRCYGYSPLVYAHGCENIAITGRGTLNGQGDAWWPWKKRQPGMMRLFTAPVEGIPVDKRVFATEADGVRPPFIQPIECRNVRIEGVTVIDGPSWNIHPVLCENVIIRGVTVKSHGPNSDGIDPDACRNVIIEDCELDTGDDCICLKAGRDEDAWAVGRALENVVIRRCRAKRGHGGVVLGSEMSGGIRNVAVEDCCFDGANRGIRIKSRPGRGGTIENIWFRNITMKHIRREAIVITLRYGDADVFKPATNRLPQLRNIDIRQIRCNGARDAVVLLGLPDAWLENITLENVEIRAATGFRAEFVRGLKVANALPRPEAGPVVHLVDVQEAAITGGTYASGAQGLLMVEGGLADNIVVRGIEGEEWEEAVVRGDGVPPGAVRVLDP